MSLTARVFLIFYCLEIIYSLGGLGQMARFFENNAELLTSVK